jgi:hypothetical protein
MNLLALDIETLAQPEADIRAKLPAFDPDKVPLGNATKADTITRIIEDARKVHGDDIVANAALYPEYGQVAIIGLMSNVEGMRQPNIEQLGEALLLRATWESLMECLGHSDIIIGWNLKGFDLPFLVKRSWMLGVKVSSRISNPFKPRYPWHESIVDLMEVYACADFRSKFTGQNAACRAMGIRENPGRGAEFGELWKRDKKAALEYNAGDLRCLLALAERML